MDRSVDLESDSSLSTASERRLLITEQDEIPAQSTDANAAIPMIIDNNSGIVDPRSQNLLETRSRSVQSSLSFDGANEICIRDAPSIALSECTKPDPPSIVDYLIDERQVIESDNGDEQEADPLLPNYDVFRPSTSNSNENIDFEAAAMSLPDCGSFIIRDGNEIRLSNNNSPTHRNEIVTLSQIDTDFGSMSQISFSRNDDSNIKLVEESLTRSDHNNNLSTRGENKVCLEPKAKLAFQKSVTAVPTETSTLSSKPTQLEPNAMHSDSLSHNELLSQIPARPDNIIDELVSPRTEVADVQNISNQSITLDTTEVREPSDSNVLKSSSPSSLISDPPFLERRYGNSDVNILPSVDEHKETPNHAIQPRIESYESERFYPQYTQNSNSTVVPVAPSLNMSNSNVSNPEFLDIPVMNILRSNGIPAGHSMYPSSNGAGRQRNGLSGGIVGRKRITLRLEEDVKSQQRKIKGPRFQNGILGHIRRKSSSMIFGKRRGHSLTSVGDLDGMDDDNEDSMYTQVSRGKLAVSWFEGTSSIELHEHVRQCIIRKLVRSQGLSSNIELEDLRLLDETSNPPEEMVLSPFIPDGMTFVCRFGVNDLNNPMDGISTPLSDYSVVRPPVSPGAAPSPHPERDLFDGLNSKQLALINSKLNASLIDSNKKKARKERNDERNNPESKNAVYNSGNEGRNFDKSVDADRSQIEKGGEENQIVDDQGDVASKESTDEEDEDTMLHSEDPIESRFREIFHLLLTERRKSNSALRERVQHEKRQVIFVVANYLVLFLAVIAISAEIQARAPVWLKMVENELLKVHNCGATQEALFECVSRGDFAGLLASVGLWFSRSLATRRIFLFGFESPKKLWTVVYEALVTAVCWAFSHLFIRRGLNPDTRERFIQKHWKDTVYGSLAAFFAAFLKMVLKNLIPQEVVEDALRDRRLKILSWLPSLATFE